MAIGFDVASESHTSITGHTGSASFNWNHAGGVSAKGALVFVFGVVTNALPPVTSVTYGGVTMTAVPYTAIDTDTEPGSVRAYYLDNCGTGTKNIVVNRSDATPWAHILYAVCYTVTSSMEISSLTEVYLAGVQTKSGSTAVATGASSTGTGTGTLALLSVTDDSPGANSLRFMGRYQGTSNITLAGTGSTRGPTIDFGLYVIDTFYESVAGQGARNVGGVTITDDVAAIALAVREKPPVAGTFTVGAVIFGTVTPAGGTKADAIRKATVSGVFYLGNNDGTGAAVLELTKTTYAFTDKKADAVVRKTIEPVGGVKADAVLLRTMPIASVSVDAVLLRTMPLAGATFAIDGVVEATVTPAGGTKADAVVFATVTPIGGTKVDAVVRTTVSLATTLNAVLGTTVEPVGGLKADAVILGPVPSGKLADAVLKRTMPGVASVIVATTRQGSSGIDEQQTVTVRGNGGTFTLQFEGIDPAAETTPLPWNVTAAAMKTALEATDHIEPGDLTVTLLGNVYTVTFGGHLAGENVLQMVPFFSGLWWGYQVPADAVLRASVTGTPFSASAVLKSTSAGSLAADADIFGEVSSHFTSDAITSVNRAATLSANAVVQSSFTIFLTADATLLSAMPFSFGADAVVRWVGSATLVLEATIHRSASGTLTTDAIIASSPTGAFDAGAWISGIFTLESWLAGRFELDAFILGETGGWFNADAWIAGPYYASFQSDAVLLRTAQSDSMSVGATLLRSTVSQGLLDATIAASVTASFSAMALVSGISSSAFTSDAVLSLSVSDSFEADAVVRGTASGSTTADAVLLRPAATATLTTDAIVARRSTSSLTLDALVRLRGFTVDAIVGVSGPQEYSFPADAIVIVWGDWSEIFGNPVRSFSVSAYIGGSVEASFTTDSVVLGGVAGTFAANALVLGETAGSILLDAIVKATASVTITADSVLLGTSSGSFPADATKKAAVQAGFGAQAVIKATRMGGFATNAVLLSPQTSSFTVDAEKDLWHRFGSFTTSAILRATLTGGFGASSIVLATMPGSLTIDAIRLRTQFGHTFLLAAILGPVYGDFTLDAIRLRTIFGSFLSDASISLRYTKAIEATVSAETIAGTATARTLDATNTATTWAATNAATTIDFTWLFTRRDIFTVGAWKAGSFALAAEIA